MPFHFWLLRNKLSCDRILLLIHHQTVRKPSFGPIRTTESGQKLGFEEFIITWLIYCSKFRFWSTFICMNWTKSRFLESSKVHQMQNSIMWSFISKMNLDLPKLRHAIWYAISYAAYDMRHLTISFEFWTGRKIGRPRSWTGYGSVAAATYVIVTPCFSSADMWLDDMELTVHAFCVLQCDVTNWIPFIQSLKQRVWNRL